MEQIECSETSANINQTPGKHLKDSTLNVKHGESLKSRMIETLLIGADLLQQYGLVINFKPTCLMYEIERKHETMQVSK
jgi:hypothetical protein